MYFIQKDFHLNMRDWGIHHVRQGQKKKNSFNREDVGIVPKKFFKYFRKEKLNNRIFIYQK
ncbi:hypothetical protein AOQ87_00230 [Candidatus Riesia pediculischaeffi]|uniref:Uncharacterized protein n=1 Tax=Candidatus Riesia pediculischaeffi TaxID=428411 RepID=A0A1V0HJZ0_9ENTR|nr:hypothetical protein AOQ87_00230 [Candidatus Riesia pediculischaeffi]